jgi:nucleotide-binding universal stress UspA family protein
MFERVVIGVRSEAGGRDAIALANRLVATDGTLTLLHVHHVASKPAPDSGAARDAEKRRLALGRLEALAAELHIDASVSTIEARSVRNGLHAFVRRERADLLVIGVSHFDDLARDMSGDDTRAVLEDAPCAVAVAPIGYFPHGAVIARIGVAYDDSAQSERALALARDLAAARGAELSAFEAVDAPLYVRETWDVRAPEIDERVDEARDRIATLGGLEADAGFGDTVGELVQFGRTVDLLVIGSHRYRPIDRLLRSTTAQQLADETSVPLLVLAFEDNG